MVIDRIEGRFAVIETAPGAFENVPLSSIEGRARDGAIVIRKGPGLTVDEAATKERRASSKQRLRTLFGKRS